MKPLYKICMSIVIMLSLASSCEEKMETTLVQDMAKFDQAFVPVLYHVMQGDMDNARKSVFYLNHTWQKFEGKYKTLNVENDDWQEAFRMSNAWLSDAYVSIDANARQDAYIFLDHVRYQFIDLREQQGVDYFLDDVWEFEATLDLAREVAVDQMLCLLDYCEFEELVSDVNYAWHEVKHQELNPKLFGWDDKQEEVFRFRLKKLKSNIGAFNKAVVEADQEELAAAATLLHEAYLDYLYCFGDFLSSRTYFAAM